MKNVYSFIVYAKEPPTQRTGILGVIDLHVIHFLLIGGKEIPQEEYEGSAESAAIWYRTYLEENGVHAIHVKTTGQTIWFQVDLEKTCLDEFPFYQDISATDTETIVWRSIWYPCAEGTTRECLGLAIGNRETLVSGVPLESLLQKILVN